MAEKKKRKQLSGSAKMYKLGKKPILIWLTALEMSKVRKAAELSRRPVAQFVVYHAICAARDLTEGLQP